MDGVTRRYLQDEREMFDRPDGATRSWRRSICVSVKRNFIGLVV